MLCDAGAAQGRKLTHLLASTGSLALLFYLAEDQTRPRSSHACVTVIGSRPAFVLLVEPSPRIFDQLATALRVSFATESFEERRQLYTPSPTARVSMLPEQTAMSDGVHHGAYSAASLTYSYTGRSKSMRLARIWLSTR